MGVGLKRRGLLLFALRLHCILLYTLNTRELPGSCNEPSVNKDQTKILRPPPYLQPLDRVIHCHINSVSPGGLQSSGQVTFPFDQCSLHIVRL